MRQDNFKIGHFFKRIGLINQNQINVILKEKKRNNKLFGRTMSDKNISTQKKTAIFLLTGLVSSSLLAGCKTPNVTNNFGIVQNYSESQVMKVLTTNPTGNINSYADGTIEVSNIPFYQQGNDNTCGQAVMASILNYWGKGVSYQDVVNQTNSWNMFTDVDKITQYLRKRGLYAQDYRKATISLLKDRINKGLPPIVLLDFGTLSSAHYVIVKGYNESTKTFIILDPIDGPNIKIKYDVFASMWENRSLRQLGLFGDKYDSIVFDVGGN